MEAKNSQPVKELSDRGIVAGIALILLFMLSLIVVATLFLG